MKKTILSLSALLCFTLANAQVAPPGQPPMPPMPPMPQHMQQTPTPPGMGQVPGANPTMPGAPAPQANTMQTPTPPAPVMNLDESAKFDKVEHDFGKVAEGPQATTEFKVKNISKEPLTISNVQASCGCTVPSWTKEPIAPGATGIIKAIYNTQGRPGNIYKTLTVTTNKGTKQLVLKGIVEKAPDTSVPAPAGASPIIDKH
jgi:Protein of unknown function (DUF1573)